ncbi:MAG TPA: hypothetical protein VMW32_03695 [Bacteroidales bacterium]|nr:hypothetical protein [Bacteroidales bacterium]
MNTIAEFLGNIILGIISVVITGFVLSKLWFWFIVPVFALPELRLIEAIGLSFLISFVWHRKSDDDTDDFVEHALYVIVYSLTMWGGGAIVHLFM